MTADDVLTPEVRRDLEAVDAALAGDPAAELTDLGRLALDLRAERPEPRPGFTAGLDARAAGGFPRRRRPGALAGLRERLRATPLLVPGTALAGLVAVAVAVGVLSSGGGGEVPAVTGFSGAGSSSSKEAAPSTDAAGPVVGPTLAQAQKSGDDAASRAGVPPVPPAPGGSPRSDGRSKRYVERSAALTIAAPPARIDEAARRIADVADQLGGFVVTSSVTSSGPSSGGQFVLRVPTARLQDALVQLSRIGHVRERRQDVTDITAERTSARARLAEARAERTSLLRRLAAATTDAEVLALRAELRDVNRRISLNRAALSRVDNRARYANVAVSLIAEHGGATGKPGGGNGWGPGDALHAAGRVLEVAAGVLLVALAAAVPLGLVAALAVLAARAARRRARERALDAV
jgi:hypothetical protein